MLYNKNPLGQTLIISLEAANPEEGELRVSSCRFLFPLDPVKHSKMDKWTPRMTRVHRNKTQSCSPTGMKTVIPVMYDYPNLTLFEEKGAGHKKASIALVYQNHNGNFNP